MSNFVPATNLREINLEIEAAMEICKKANVQEDRLISTIVGIVQISTGVNVLDLLELGFRLSMGDTRGET